MTVKTGGEADAIVLLLDSETREARRAIYVRRDETGTMTSLPAGSYRVQFQLGQDWLRPRRVCSISSTSEFQEAMEFTQHRTETGTQYSRVELTLYSVRDGNAGTNGLPNVPLALPEP